MWVLKIMLTEESCLGYVCLILPIWCMSGGLFVNQINSQFMAPRLSNNSVKAFAKQMIFYNVYQVRVGSGVHH